MKGAVPEWTTSPQIAYGVYWISQPSDYRNVINDFYYKNGKFPEYFSKIANAMMGRFPETTDHVMTTYDDVEIKNEEFVLFATHPRPSALWIYDFLKSDICVIGSLESEAKIKEKFEKEKKAAQERKGQVSKYIEAVKPVLVELVENKLAVAVLGRGSYFGKNGYPVPDDDVDFILLTGKEKLDYPEITEILKTIPLYRIEEINEEDRIIKEGQGVVLSFSVVSSGMIKHSTGRKYDRYVLLDSRGIDLPGLASNESELIARKFAESIPNKYHAYGKMFPILPDPEHKDIPNMPVDDKQEAR